MATDFAIFLRRFLTGHLAGLRGYSPNTIASYRDAFKLLICYFRDERHIPPEKLTLGVVMTGRCALSGRGQRLASQLSSSGSWFHSARSAVTTLA